MFEAPTGATPLAPDTIAGLIPDLHMRSELAEFEQLNIEKATQWSERSRTLKKDLLTIHGLRLLHQRMFDDTWKWAGEFRQCETNIGVVPSQIQAHIAQLLGNMQWQLDNPPFDWDSLAARFHHQLVFVHPFPNGNGRHGRLASDLLLAYNKQVPFTWGRTRIDVAAKHVRAEYIAALQAADRGNLEQLLTFVRS